MLTVKIGVDYNKTETYIHHDIFFLKSYNDLWEVDILSL